MRGLLLSYLLRVWIMRIIFWIRLRGINGCKGGLEKIAKLEGNFENSEDDIDSYNQTIRLGKGISSDL